jgi:MFS family permease
VIWPSAVLYVFAIMMTSLCKEYWQFLLAQGLLTGLADGLLMFPAISATSQYFNKNRGAAMGIAIAGSSVGGVIFPIALGKMLTESNLGFGWSIRICGFIIIPFLAFSCVTVTARLPPRDTDFFLPSAFKVPLFNTLVASEFCLLIGMFSPLVFIPTFAITIGVEPTLASYLVAMLNGASIFGRVLPGFLADKFGRLNMLVAAGVSSGILIFVWPKVTGTAGIIVFSVFFGFCSGAIISGGSVALSLCPEDPKDTGTYLGQGMAFASLAALVGPPVTGALLDKYGGFTQVSIFGGVLTLAGAALAMASKLATPQGIFGKV